MMKHDPDGLLFGHERIQFAQQGKEIGMGIFPFASVKVKMDPQILEAYAWFYRARERLGHGDGFEI